MSGILIYLTGNQNMLVLFWHVFWDFLFFLNHFPHIWHSNALNIFYTWKKHIYEVIDVTFVEESSGRNGRWKNINKKIINIVLVPSQRYQDSRHLLQNPKVPRTVMGFNNRAQRFTGSNYLDVDSPLVITTFRFLICFGFWARSSRNCVGIFKALP